MKEESRVISLGGYSFRTHPYELTPEVPKFDKEDFEHLDSSLEGYFDWWAAEAIACGFLDSVHLVQRFTLTMPITEHRQKQLKTKMSWKDKKISRGVTYEPDRALFFNMHDKRQMAMVDQYFRSDEKDMIYYASSPQGYFKCAQWGNYMVCVIDIKPPVVAMRQASGNMFPIKQALLWEQGLFVQKVILIPSTKNKNFSTFLFAATWTPDRFYRTDKSGAPRTIHYKPKRNVIQYEKHLGYPERLI